MSVDVSIVLSCYNRSRQLEKTLESIKAQNVKPELIVVEDGNDGKTEYVAKAFGAKYFRKNRTDLPAFQNPSRVHNIGIQRATGRVVILQGGEVLFNTRPNAIADLTAPVLANPNVATSPIVQALGVDGRILETLSAPSGCPRAGWIINFCLAVDRSKLLKIGGFEESYTGYGFEDDQLMFSLRREGVIPRYVENVIASHQWHERTNYDFSSPGGRSQFDAFIHQVETEGRPPVANIGREWGKL